MTICAQVSNFQQANATTLYVTCAISFVLSGTAYNFSHQFINIAAPSSLTDVTINTAIRDAVSDYVDTNYGTTTTGLNVALIAGAVPVVL